MYGPLHMAVNENRHVMVTDHGNSRVLQLNSSVGIYLVLREKKYGLRLPCKIHFNALKKLLSISDSDYSLDEEQSTYM